jgi:hypothetical protein
VPLKAIQVVDGGSKMVAGFEPACHVDRPLCESPWTIDGRMIA